jgi:Galactose oxidase, central domain
MSRAIAFAALSGFLAAIAACTPKLEIPAGSKVSCADNGQCPAGRICHSGYCVDPGSVDTVPPDLAAPPVVTPSIGKAGATFVVAVTSTKNLLQPPSLVLGLDVPVEVTCVLASGRSYTCPYTATGNENGGAGGLVSFDVRLLDTSYNEVVKRLAGALRLDFRPPDVLPGSASLVLIPPAANPLRTLGAAGSGTTIHVAFTVDEALASDPAVTGAGPGTSLVFSKLGAAGESFVFEYVLADPSPGQGTYAVDVTLTDVAGNVAIRTLSLPGAGLVVDTVPPAAPATGTANAVVYDRVPWGSQATSGSPRFDVSGAVGAVEGNAVVQVFDGPDPATAAELGRGAAATNGSFAPISVGRADHVVVYVAAVDAAGNRSPLSDVRDIRWTATLDGKVPGSAIENPTRLVSTPWLAPVAAQDPGIAVEPDQASLDAVKLPDSSSLTRAAEQRWLQRNAASAGPLRRYKHTMAYDSDRGKMMVFGGFATDTARDQNDLWEWDGAAGLWTDRTPVGLRPGPSQAAVMVYDQRRARMLMFVGDDDLTGGTATWEWDPATGFWFDRSPPGGSPSPTGRTFFAMAYDAARGTAVLFGGTSAVTYADRNDTWEWDGAAGAWTQRLPDGDANSPGARDDMAMAYDSARGKVVLWGGYGGSGADDTWEWDGNAGTWTHVVAAIGPTSDGEARMAYDAARQKLVLWGGGNWTTSRTLWEYDPAGPSWNDRTPAGTLPCGVEDVGLAYDVGRGRTVLFGGVGSSCPGNVYTNQVWDWIGSAVASPGTWTNRTVSTSSVPIGRKNHAMAYDPVRRKVVLYGGGTDGGLAGGAWTPLSDTWEMDPDTGTWTLRTPASNPGPRDSMAMAFDPARKTIILFGGTRYTPGPPASYNPDAETWEWNGVTGTWTKLTPATSPSARASQAMVTYVRGGVGKILMFGGVGSSFPAGNDTTWEWDGAIGNWSNPTFSSGGIPDTRFNPGLAWDSDRQRVMMYGGYDALFGAPYNRNDLWEWSGTAWTTYTIANPPPLRTASFGFVYDLARRKLVLWGGEDPTSYNAMGDIWEWDATTTTWANRTPSSGVLPARYSLGAWYDPVRRAPTMFGGAGNFWEAFKQDTWEWQPGDQARPALVWTVPWGASGEKNARFLAVDVSASAAGLGSDTSYPAAVVSGASILGWDHLGGGWRTLASNASGGAPAPMTYGTVDPVDLARILPGTALYAAIAVVPVGLNQKGTALSHVKLDYLELVVTYRRGP